MFAPVTNVFVSEIEDEAPGMPSATWKLPVNKLAVKVGAVAMPFLSVVALADRIPPAKVPDAKDDGAVNVTSVPGTGLAPLSVTSA
jgi:hypothetical protein